MIICGEKDACGSHRCPGPASQMSTYLATERTTSTNSMFAYSNITVPKITPTSDISASTTSFLNTGSTNMYAHTESTIFYSNTRIIQLYTKTETTNLYANFETTNFYANTVTTSSYAKTETNAIQTQSLRIVSNSMSTYQSMFVTTAAKYISGSFDTSSPIMSETIVLLPNNSISSRLPSSTMDTMERFLNTPHIFNTSYQDDTCISMDDLTVGFQTFSQDYADSVSTFLRKFYDLSLQTSEYQATMQTDFTSYVPMTSFYESNTYNTHDTAKGVYSSEKVSSTKSDMYTSALPIETQLWSVNDVQSSTTYFQSNTFEPYSLSTDEGFSSEMSEYVISSVFLPLNMNANVTVVDSSIKTRNLLIFETQSGKLTISPVLPDFETTSIDFNNDSIPSMIKPSSQQTSSDNSYIEIGTLFKDSMFSSSYVTKSRTSNYLIMTTLSLRVFESIRTSSTSTIASGLSEKNKTIIFVSTSSAVVTIIAVILLIMFARMNMSKHNMKLCKEGDNKSLSNNSSPHKTAFPDFSFTRKNKYPMFNTSFTSFKMQPYEHNWNDIV